MEDKLDRLPIIENLTQILGQLNLENGIVLGIDAGWGKGKTTFIDLWEKYLEENNRDTYNVIKYNAWDNDDNENPLVSLAIELEELLIGETKGEIYTFVKELAKGVLPNLLERYTGIKPDDVNALINAHKALEYDPIKQEKNRRDLKKKLKDSIRKITEEKKIIFFIDELDRCRPSYAIELLETVKHLFNVKNCIFIIAWDKEQLSHSIKTIYGSDMDSLGYLRRFVDLDYQLPEPSKEKYIKLLFEKENLLNGYYSTFYEMIPSIVEIYDLSLRDIDKFVFYLKIHFERIEKNEKTKNTYKYVYSLLKSILCIIKLKNTELYMRIKGKKYEIKDISKMIEELKISKINEKMKTEMRGLDKYTTTIIDVFLQCNIATDIYSYKEYELFNSEGWTIDDRLSMVYFCENNRLFNEIEFLENLNKD